MNWYADAINRVSTVLRNELRNTLLSDYFVFTCICDAWDAAERGQGFAGSIVNDDKLVPTVLLNELINTVGGVRWVFSVLKIQRMW